jgi:hypothetical protein
MVWYMPFTGRPVVVRECACTEDATCEECSSGGTA